MSLLQVLVLAGLWGLPVLLLVALARAADKPEPHHEEVEHR